MNVRIIVPRRGDGGHRDRLWEFCRAYWRRELPDVPIIEGVHDDGPFNRSAAINRAACGPWDVAVILDADVILDTELVTAGIDTAARTGMLTVPFVNRNGLSEQGTERVLAGFQGSWKQWIVERQNYNQSTCIVVPRALWDDVGGFDERFEGWGGEDNAFYAACYALRGNAQHPKLGDAWHLWHKPSPHKNFKHPLYVQAKLLADRYIATKSNATRMRALLAEPRTPDATLVVVLTNGRRDALMRRALASIDEHLHGPIVRRLVVADGANVAVPEHWDTVQVRGGRYYRAMHSAQAVAVGSGQPWIFWVEDDFVLTADVDVSAMQRIMVEHDEVLQVSLMRQPWYDHEKAAGSVIAGLRARDGRRFVQRDGYVEHRAYWTQNPMLVARHTLAAVPWPQVPNSEAEYGRLQLTRDPDGCYAIFGDEGDEPRALHIGEQRASGLGH